MPPAHLAGVMNSSPAPATASQRGGGGKTGSVSEGSLWIEAREGRIKVLDIKGVCDDGIDTLEPQLGPICDWIERARLEGGQVLVHCRVGVSRSATVTVSVSLWSCFGTLFIELWSGVIDRVRDEAPWTAVG